MFMASTFHGYLSFLTSYSLKLLTFPTIWSDHGLSKKLELSHENKILTFRKNWDRRKGQKKFFTHDKKNWLTRRKIRPTWKNFGPREKISTRRKNFFPREKISTNEIVVPREHEPTKTCDPRDPRGHETHEIYETHKSVQDLYPWKINLHEVDMGGEMKEKTQEEIHVLFINNVFFQLSPNVA